MSYYRERDEFIARMTQEGLGVSQALQLLRAASTLQFYAELACSSEAADRDRVSCPASPVHVVHPVTRLIGKPRKPTGPCCCDCAVEGEHDSVPRYRVREARLEARVAAMLAAVAPVPCTPCAGEGLTRAAGQPARTCGACNGAGRVRWEMETQGDPRGYVLRVIPPSYAARNAGRDRHNREAIGVPARPSRVRW